MGCEGLELHFLHWPHTDSIDLDPHSIFGMRSDIYDVLKNYGDVSKLSGLIGDNLIHAF